MSDIRAVQRAGVFGGLGWVDAGDGSGAFEGWGGGYSCRAPILWLGCDNVVRRPLRRQKCRGDARLLDSVSYCSRVAMG